MNTRNCQLYRLGVQINGSAAFLLTAAVPASGEWGLLIPALVTALTALASALGLRFEAKSLAADGTWSSSKIKQAADTAGEIASDAARRLGISTSLARAIRSAVTEEVELILDLERNAQEPAAPMDRAA